MQDEVRRDFPSTAEGVALLVKELRNPHGCPWDRKQTLESLRSSLCGECAEVVEAIDLGDRENLCEELGDLMLQVVFHSDIAKENNEFDIGDVTLDLAGTKSKANTPSIPSGIINPNEYEG